MTVRSLPRATSTMRMQVRVVTGVAASPSLTARSTTGTTLPRRLMTPRIEAGTEGTRVMISYWRISFTWRMPTAKSDPATEKDRNWRRSAGWLALKGPS